MLALLCAASLACAREAHLSGSVGELFPLEASRVEIRRNAEAFQVTYLSNRGVELDVVIRLTVALEGLELTPGMRFPLEGEHQPNHARTTVVHAPGGEPVRLFPRVKKGEMTLTGGNPGERASGDFSMLFESTGGDLGQGRTLSGTFSGVAQDAGF